MELPKYILVSTQIRTENGPTIVGDADSDPALMCQLEATLESRLGNNFAEFVTSWAPRKVLNELAKMNYRVVAMSGIGQTCVWTLELRD
ncbi:unnamed protein product [Bursaphelenchus okinawaensis]|uniref:GTP cyclohydrolase 1 feedback regulatory protein n=1 Tax=Bursaphelenchus okinawaensis TaxID=465554 RepID=A0A811KTA6_9BILA|nr:unnamed protein product [Bursaphelenchus okinawaensis]CAG9112907.1 unnamed protein product [Bursaphelenchus okinawaensis]